MYPRTVYTPPRASLRLATPRPNRQPVERRRRFSRIKLFGLMGIIIALCIFSIRMFGSHAAAESSTIRSAISGYCLDVRHNDAKPGIPVQSWPCNDSDAQDWTLNASSLVHGNNLCMDIAANNKIVANPCDKNDPNQVWLRSQTGFLNPHSGLCLSLPDGQTGKQLVAATCHMPAEQGQHWVPAGANASRTFATLCNQGSKGEKIACTAEKEWYAWQSGTPSHEALLTAYTGGAAYEAWCADFVSYVYREAGYAFTRGSANGWNENNANNIQYLGFTKHDPSDYTPKPGDVAYFDYDGGHVEIVVSGGKTPTFIYGNSATIDPTTGNGQMATNTITKDGAEGQLVYYLSPN